MRRLRFACLIGVFAAGACGGSKNAATTGTAGTTGGAGTTGAAGTSGSAGTTGIAGATGTGGGNGGSTGGAVDASADRALTPFEEQALAIAAEYIGLGPRRRRAALGAVPLPPAATRASRATASRTTERRTASKLYSVFAKNDDAYPNGPHDGQVVVKQSWKVELVPDAGRRRSARSTARPTPSIDADHFYPYAQGDGGVYRAGAPAGLFIMFRLDPATPDTDEGWVYATVSPAGQVTVRRPRRQLHGLPRDQRDARAPVRRPAQPVASRNTGPAVRSGH